MRRGEQDVLVARRLQHGDQLVALAERQRTDAGLSGRIQAVQLEPLDRALLRHEEQIVLFKIVYGDARRDLFARLERQDVDDVRAARGASGLGI